MFNGKLKRENQHLMEEIMRLHKVIAANHTYESMMTEINEMMYCNGLDAQLRIKLGGLEQANTPEYQYHKGYSTACKQMLDFLEGKQ